MHKQLANNLFFFSLSFFFLFLFFFLLFYFSFFFLFFYFSFVFLSFSLGPTIFYSSNIRGTANNIYLQKWKSNHILFCLHAFQKWKSNLMRRRIPSLRGKNLHNKCLYMPMLLNRINGSVLQYANHI